MSTFGISFSFAHVGQTMALIAHESKRAFGYGEPLSDTKIHQFHIVFAFTSLALTLATVLPSEPALNASGLYCTPGWSDATSFGLFFGIGIAGLALVTVCTVESRTHVFVFFYPFSLQHTYVCALSSLVLIASGMFCTLGMSYPALNASGLHSTAHQFG